LKGGICIDWTIEETKLIWWSVRKATQNYSFLPLRYERQDLFQEAAEAWLSARDGWREEKGQKSTFLYGVVEKRIRDLIDAGDTEKRKSDLHAIKYMENVMSNGFKYGEGNRKVVAEPIDYDGDKNIKYNPVPRGKPMAYRLREEREPEIWEEKNEKMSGM
jgi:DNA-directed RNA polymerase specialized sigma24 family protein